MKYGKVKSLLISFLWLSLIIMVAALIIGSVIFIVQVIGNKVTLDFLFRKIYIAIILLGYSIAIYFLLETADSFKENLFVKINIKRFNVIGCIFFIEAVIEAIYSSIFKPDEGIAQIFGFNITIALITLVIISLTFFLITSIFDEAIKIKEDNDLTI